MLCVAFVRVHEVRVSCVFAFREYLCCVYVCMHALNTLVACLRMQTLCMQLLVVVLSKPKRSLYSLKPRTPTSVFPLLGLRS